MSAPSRADIRSRLRQAAQQGARVATRVTRRVAPKDRSALVPSEQPEPQPAPISPAVAREGSAPRPTHRAYVKPDYSMCCADHEEAAFRPVRSWVV
jgi:hypothetical protein